MRIAGWTPPDRVPRMSREWLARTRLVSDVLRIAGVNEAAFFRHPNVRIVENNAASLACVVLLQRRGVRDAEIEGLLGRIGIAVDWDPRRQMFKRRAAGKGVYVQCSDLALKIIEQYEREHAHEANHDLRSDGQAEPAGRRLDVPKNGKRHRVVRGQAG